MGGPCFLVEGQSKVRGPPCTDNFQIRPFQYRGQVYHSCEQAYQAMKYKEGSKARDMVAKISPRDGESSRDHGMRCWSAGNAGTADEKCSNWDEVKVDTMLDVNRAKYAQYSDLCEELLKTGDIEIVGGPSTSWVVQGRDHLWETWNGRIQMLIREELKKTPNRTRLEILREYFTSYKSLFCVVGGVPRIPPAEPKVPQSTEEHEIDIRSTEPTLSALKAELEELKKFGFEIPWTCPSCTILNESFPSICELCSTINEQYKSAMEARMAAAKDGVGTVITERIKTFSSLLKLCRKAAEAMSSLVCDIYSTISVETKSALSKLKDDLSEFTIADGIVQAMIYRLFDGKFRDIVGEEDQTCEVNIDRRPYTVGDIVVPDNFYAEIENLRVTIDELSSQIDPNWFKNITCFVDPIDGTKEFSSKRGEQCSICIGFANELGASIAGIIYRPISNTWAAGAAEEHYFETYPERNMESAVRGFLGSNSGISPFLQEIRDTLGLPNIQIGGAANKALMLVEGRGSCYILDSGGPSRWDTCASEAVLRAGGGKFWKLTEFLKSPRSEEIGYTYLKGARNSDFDPTRTSRAQGMPYTNLCGHVALAPGEDVDEYWQAAQRSREISLPQFP